MDSRDRRGQANIVGYALLILLTIVGATTVVLLGGTALSSLEEQASSDRAEVVMSNFDAEAGRVALGAETTKRVRMGGRGSASVDDAAGTVRVELVGCGAACPRTFVDESLGAVEYRTGETTVAYQGGGVWRVRDGHARMVSPPEFHYQRETLASGDSTLTLPVVVVRGSGRTGEAFRVEEGPMRRAFPNAALGRENPLESGSVRITVESDYYEGWATYFEERTDADTVTMDHANGTVTVLLSIPTGGREMSNAVASRESSVVVRGGAYIDSYNSSQGSYAATRGDDGSIYVGENLANSGGGTIYGDMRVDGDFDGGGGIDVEGRLLVDGDADLRGGGVSVNDEIIADGDLYLSGGSSVDSPVTVNGAVYETGGGVDVNGDVRAGRDYHGESGTIDGDVHVGGDFHAANGQNINGDVVAAGEFDDDGVWPNVNGNVVENGPEPDLSAVDEASSLDPPNLQPVDGEVSSRVAEYAGTNDNGPVAARVENGDCGGASPSCTLTAGTYHFDDLRLDGSDHLTFDTSGGPIYVAVDGDVETTGGSSVDVVGNERVHVYATGDYAIRTDWRGVGSRGDQIWLYGTSSSTVTFRGGATFYGAVYAPGNRDITVRGGAEVYGGIVGGVGEIQGGTAVHYDTALSAQEPRLGGGGGPPVSYLHVTVNELRVEAE